MIGVGALNSNNTIASFSNFGVNANLMAPGVGIRSTFWDGKYASWSGTSFASPFVAAEAAEVISKFNLGPVITDLLVTLTATNIDALNPSFAGELGAGIINVQASLKSHSH